MNMKMFEQRLDPAIADIVADAVSDGRSAIFRLPGGDSELRRSRSDELRPYQSRLTTVDRHLLAVHREELGRFLREAFLLEFDRDSRTTRDFSRGFESPSRTEWHTRLGSVDASAERLGDRIGGAVRPTLEAVRLGLASGPTATQWAALALRVEACDEARIYAASDLLNREQLRTAVHLLEDIVSGPVSATNARCAWRNLGLAHLKLASLEAALDAFEHAAELARDDATPALYALAVALLHGDGHRALMADARANELGHATDTCVRAFLGEVQTSPYLKVRAPLRVRHTLSQVRNSLGPIGLEVAHAIHA